MTYTVIKTSAISSVTEVRLYDDVIEHVTEEHPEVPIGLPTVLAGVTNAVANPTHVESSYGGSFVFVDSNSTNASGDPLRVPVKPVKGTSARVRTAYFATAENPQVIWRRPS